MKLKEIKEQVMSVDVGINVLHHGTLLPLIRRPFDKNKLIMFKNKKKIKKIKNKIIQRNFN